MLYDDYANGTPIVDPHTHADDARLASDTPYENPWAVTGQGDHYVYSAMRQMGISEDLITGDGDPREKWRALCSMMPSIGSNPINFWLHNGLRHSLKIDSVMRGIDGRNADRLWDEINDRLRDPEFSPRGLLKEQGVVFLGTTDDPTSTLKNHGTLRDDNDFQVEVVPTFRPDKIVTLLSRKKDLWSYLDTLSEVSGIKIQNFWDFGKALDQRHAAFLEVGCRATDHGPDNMPTKGYDNVSEAYRIFNKAEIGDDISVDDIEVFSGWLLGRTAELNAAADSNVVMQLHAGGLRNMKTREFFAKGPDIGYDGCRNNVNMQGYWNFFNWANTHQLFDKGLRIIAYPINSKDQDAMASMARVHAGNVFLGSSWWFIDTANGMRRQFEDAEGSLLLPQSHAGMVSDTRSPITTLPRHDMFRQELCLHTGEQIERGRITPEQAINQVQNLCHRNARRLFNVPEPK